MAKQVCITEDLKATDQIERVRRMNNVKERTEEIVIKKLVCS